MSGALAVTEGAMNDFAVWLKNLPSEQDADLQALQAFAATHGGTWPYGSNDVGDYVPVVAQQATDATRGQLLSTLARRFADWKVTCGANQPGFWKRLGSGIVGNLGPILLALFGLIVAGVLTYGIFFGRFLSSIADPEQARGLITFLFSFTTIAVFILVAVTTFWMDKAQVEERFNKAKDLLTMMIGIFGTILGFYYGSLAHHGNEQNPLAMSLANVGVPSVIVAPGDKTTIGATVMGGAPPLTYDVFFSDPTGSIKTDDLTVQGRPIKDGKIAEPVTIPAGVTKPLPLTFTLAIHDANGNQTQAIGTLIVQPKPTP
jgi:putative Ca2+/H+ antiporter (TMEM165/GDT1 family)